MIKSIKVRLKPNNKQLTKLFFNMLVVLGLLIIGQLQENEIIISKETDSYMIMTY